MMTSNGSGTLLRPATLAERLEPTCAGRALLASPRLIAFPYDWQVPAATEKAAHDAMSSDMEATPGPGFQYLGFPWATLIDGLRADAPAVPALLLALRSLAALPRPALRRATVAQHIHALKFLPLYKASGVTDLLWSHATIGTRIVEGIRIHAFPLFPAQTPNDRPPTDPPRTRPHLANFIGAYNPRIYLTGVRGAIFEDAGKLPDVLIIRREAWHFDRAVYEEQMQGLACDEQRRRVEAEHAREYLQAIRDSWFTLCPSGSGPNSIRVFESLCLGSIPIVLTRDLRLAGPAALWERAALIEDDSTEGYRRALATARAMSEERRLAMLRAGAELCQRISPGAYGMLIQEALQNT